MACRAVFNEVTWKTIGFDVAADVALTSAVFHVALSRTFRLYDLSSLIASDLRRIAAVWAGVLLLVVANIYALKSGDAIPRGFIVLDAAMLLGVVCTVRLLIEARLPSLIAEKVVAGHPVIVLGIAEEVETLTSRDLFRHFGVSEVVRVLMPLDHLDDASSWDSLVAEALAAARSTRTEEFILALPWAAVDRLESIERRLRVSPLPVRLLPDSGARSLLARQGGGMTPAPQLIDLQRAPLSVWERATKRCVDLFVAATTLLLLAPLLLVVAALVKLDTPGPTIFHQRRNGFNQRAFVIHKFRTMRVVPQTDEFKQAQRNDDRITRIGRILRRTSIDELPQLLNVLKGEMSIVGPRPHAIAHDEQYETLIGDYCLRHHVKPGITGWAQVNGLRGETQETERMSRRVELDLWYVSNWSLALDFKIMLRTAFELMSHDAY